MRVRRTSAIFALVIVTALLLVPTSPSGSSRPAGTSLQAAQGPGEFAVTFTESGLPSGTSWSVTVDGSGTNSSTSNQIVFYLVNNSYNWHVGSVTGYTPNPPSGSFTVANGTQAVGPIVWSPISYTVTFSQTGLPGGNTWSVTLNGAQEFASAGSVIQFTEIDGTYPFSVSSSAPQYSPSPSSGSVTVFGANKPVAITFSLPTYQVTFTETGLPGGTSWTVDLAGTKTSGTGPTILAQPLEPNGTYPFSITTANPDYAPSPASGSVTINGAGATQPISFLPQQYVVTFTESTLPAGTSWSVTYNKVLNSSTSTSISFTEYNGTYNYLVQSSNSSWKPVPARGSVTVSGASVQKPVTFIVVEYVETFTEVGLPNGTYWSVNVGATNYPSNMATIPVYETNNTYAYTVTPISGWSANAYRGSFTIAGSGASTTITWTRVTYLVWFNETGLPAGFPWGITVGGAPYNTTAASIELPPLPNGSYSFSVRYIADYQVSERSGTVVLNGASQTVSLTFTLVTYSVTFYEVGLPVGTNWSIDFAGRNSSATVPSISFTAGNGTYNYTVSSPTGYVPFPPGGSQGVNGKNVTLTIKYTGFSYLVLFNETGLIFPASWAVTVDGIRHTSNTSSVSFEEANGSYSFVIGTERGYNVTPTAGGFLVAGGPVTLSVAFSAHGYAFAFLEVGLPSQDNWTVILNGVLVSASAGSPIVFPEPNGTFSFTVTPPQYFLPVPPNGNVTVRGRSNSTTIYFVPVAEFAVTFTETGLAPGTGWSVSAGGTLMFSASSTATILLPNGTFGYYLGFVPGYTTPSTSGVVNISGVPVSITVTFYGWANVTGPKGGLTEGQWVLVGSGVAAATIVGIALMIRRRRTREDDGETHKHAPL